MGKHQTAEMRAGRLARVAAKRIEKNGWAKGTARDDNGGLCVRAALASAFNDNWKQWDTIHGKVNQACKLFTGWLVKEGRPYATGDLHIWNDGGWRDGLDEKFVFPQPQSRDEVIAILNKFADDMDPQR